MSAIINPFLIGGGNLSLSQSEQWQNVATSDRTITNATDGYLVVLGWRDGSGNFYTYAKSVSGVTTLELLGDYTQPYGSAAKGGASIYRLKCDANAVITIYGTNTRSSTSGNQNGAFIELVLS